MSFADSLPGPERKILAVSSTTTDFILDTLASHQSSSVLEWARVYTTAAAASQPASCAVSGPSVLVLLARQMDETAVNVEGGSPVKRGGILKNPTRKAQLAIAAFILKPTFALKELIYTLKSKRNGCRARSIDGRQKRRRRRVSTRVYIYCRI
jgi:hypothetical protein